MQLGMKYGETSHIFSILLSTALHYGEQINLYYTIAYRVFKNRR